MGPFIDSHLHFGCHRRLQELERYAGTLSLEKLCLLSLPNRRRINFNPELISAKAALPQRCYILGSFDYSSLFFPALRAKTDLAAQVEVLRELGFDGLKLWEGKPAFQQELGLRLDDPPLRTALEKAARLGMPACVHVGDPPEFWKGGAAASPRKSGLPPSASRWPSWEAFIRQAESLAEAHPGLALIFPHLLFLAGDLRRLRRLLRRQPSVWVDLSPGNYFYAELSRRREKAVAFFQEFQDRILFGSDSLFFCRPDPVLDYAALSDNLKRFQRLLRFLGTTEELENPFAPSRGRYPSLRGLGLPGPILEKICRENHLRLFGGRPADLNRCAAAAYLEQFISILASGGGRPADIRALAEQRDLGRG